MHPFLISVLVLLLAFRAEAIITLGHSDPEANTTAPTDPALADSGWELTAFNGQFTAFPIAPYWCVGIQHVGLDDTIWFRDEPHTVVGHWYSGEGTTASLVLIKVAQPFPAWSTIYAGGNELGKTAVMIGRGTQRGAEIWSTCSNAVVTTTYATNPITLLVTNSVLCPLTNYTTAYVTNYNACNTTNYATNVSATKTAVYETCKVTNYVRIGRKILYPYVTYSRCLVTLANYKTNVTATVVPAQCPVVSTVTVTNLTFQSCDVVSSVVSNVVTGSSTTNVTSAPSFAGWKWGTSDIRLRWGTNLIGHVYGAPSIPTYALWFALGQGDDAGTVSGGDSSGGLFLHDGTSWKLAGILYAAVGSGPYALTKGGTGQLGAYVNVGGLWAGDNQFKCGSGMLLGSYATRLPGFTTWINQTMADNP